MPKSSREACRVQRSTLNSDGENWSNALLLHLEKWSFSIPSYFLSGMKKTVELPLPWASSLPNFNKPCFTFLKKKKEK